MQKRLLSLAPIYAALSLCLANGAQANLISAADVAAYSEPEEGARASVLTNFWDNTPQAPSFYLDASSLIVQTRVDSKLRFGVEAVSPNPFNFAVSAPPAYSAGFNLSLGSNFRDNPGLNFNPRNPAFFSGFDLR